MSVLQSGALVIDVEDVVALGNVDDALADFYSSVVGAVADSTGVPERAIRAWFDDELINEQGFRAQVLSGPGDAGDEVLRGLEDAHLIRADSRRGAEWYELAHDRLVEPVRASNAVWRSEHLSSLQREAGAWDRQSRPAGLLMSGEALGAAVAWAGEHPEELSEVDRAYLDACQENERRVQAIAAAAVRNRRLARLAAGLAAVALVALGASIALWRRESASADRAEQALAAEQAALADAAASAEEAVQERDRATMALADADAAAAEAERQREVAEQAEVEAEAAAADAIQQRDMAEAARQDADASALVAAQQRDLAILAQAKADQAAELAEEQRNVALTARTQAQAARDDALASQSELVEVLKAAALVAYQLDFEIQLRERGGAVDSGAIFWPFDAVPDESCATAGTARSTLASDPGPYISFDNEAGVRASLFWISPAGRRVRWADIAPADGEGVNTMAGWVFVVTDPAGNCLFVV